MLIMKRSRILRIITLIIFVPLFALYSYWLVVPTVYGDAESYQSLYDALSKASFHEVRELGVFYVSSNELTPYIIWIGAKLGIAKNIYITFFNIILLCGILFFVINRKISFSIIFFTILMVTNFYVVVLMTSAERLKFAYIFLILAALSKGRMKTILFLSSITMHFQSILLVSGQLVYLYSRKIKETLLGKSSERQKGSILKILILIALVTVSYIYFKNGILVKADVALERSSNSISELAQLFLLFIASIILLKKKFETCIMFLFYSMAILLIGGSRVNMIVYTSVVYIILSEGALNRFTVRAVPFYLIAIYLSFKSIGYIERTFIQGHGWPL